jgi:hypothetical protein
MAPGRVEMKIQSALGINFRRNSVTIGDGLSNATLGGTMLAAMREWVHHYLNLDDGSDLTSSIHSDNLRKSAEFSARNARTAYLLAKMTLLASVERKGIVRTQIIEYGSVAEAILLDVVQSVGMHDSPAGRRPQFDSYNRGKPIAWDRGGLFRVEPARSNKLVHQITFDWLIREARRIGVIDVALMRRIVRLRQRRNLVHAVIPTAQRYSDDLASAKTAREIVVELRDACLAFKAANHLQT